MEAGEHSKHSYCTTLVTLICLNEYYCYCCGRKIDLFCNKDGIMSNGLMIPITNKYVDMQDFYSHFILKEVL